MGKIKIDCVITIDTATFPIAGPGTESRPGVLVTLLDNGRKRVHEQKSLCLTDDKKELDWQIANTVFTVVNQAAKEAYDGDSGK